MFKESYRMIAEVRFSKLKVANHSLILGISKEKKINYLCN